MRRVDARYVLEFHLAGAIRGVLESAAEEDNPELTQARDVLVAWESEDLYRLAARAVITIFEAAREGDRLRSTEGAS